METFYYPKTIKNITTALLDVFNDMVVKKYDSSGTEVQEYIVPIQFGPIEKAQSDRIENHYYDTSGTGRDTQVYESGNRFYYMIPRMSLILNSITYDGNRCYGPNEWRHWFTETLELSGTSDIDQVFRDYQPTPYNLGYTLNIMTDSVEYFAQIMENILPYFNPKLFLRVKEFSFLNIERDLPTIIDGISPEFIDDMDNTQTRYTNATIALTVEAFMYRPFDYSKIIKIINSRYFIADDVNITSAGIVSASDYSTSAFSTSGGEIETSALPASGTYSFSGTTSGADDETYYWYTSANNNNW